MTLLNSDNLNGIIHERARLLILTLIASSDTKDLIFKELQTKLKLSAGNLSVQLKTLEKTGYISIKKEFNENKPQTSVSITLTGREALNKYLIDLEQIIKSIREKS